MFRLITIILFISSITACKPFSSVESENQFTLKNKQLVFMGHKLGYWSEKEIPQCKLCSFNIYTKKIPKGAMLFKEVNNERGDLVFLSAANLRHHFALQTGGHSYSIGIKINNQMLLLSSAFFEDITLKINEVKLLEMDNENYFVSLQKVNAEKGSVDLIFWFVEPL